MRPLDPRLMKYAKSARLAILLTCVLGVLQALTVIAQCFLISALITPVIHERATYENVKPMMLWLLVVVGIRAILTWLRTAHQHRSAKKAINQLREQVLKKALRLGPRWLAKHGTDTVTLSTRGLENLGPYFIDYIPQLILTCTVTPITLAVMCYMDYLSGIAAILTLPLIPIFMIIIGLITRDASEKRLATMQQLGRQLLDLLAGLPTLKALGRQHGPEKQIEKLGKTYTKNTMATLRIAFLSGAVLEFIATLSVAIIAVSVGLRLVNGYQDLHTGLVVIMLAPEIYLPLREVGKHYHAAADGISAANSVFAILEREEKEDGQLDSPDLRQSEIQINQLSYPTRGSWTPYQTSFILKPGKITALRGKSGSGKTTAAMVLLKQLPLCKGSINIKDGAGKTIDFADISNESWWQQTSWLPQATHLFSGTLWENLVDGLPEENPRFEDYLPQLEEAAQRSGFSQVLEQLPKRWHNEIGESGIGLSVGQRQRFSLLKALLTERQLIILDEPTAHLDAHLEKQVLSVLETLRARNKTILVIAHRQTLIKIADQVVETQTQVFSDEEMEKYSIEEENAAYGSEAVLEPTFIEFNREEAARA